MTKESNRLIAAFLVKDEKMSDLENYLSKKWDFHKDWNELMAVVEKINSKGYPIDIATGILCKLSNALTAANIKEAYKYVVEFVKWYNLNLQK